MPTQATPRHADHPSTTNLGDIVVPVLFPADRRDHARR